MPKRYCDGIHDDLPYLQSLVDEAYIKGTSVEIPRGAYFLGGDLVVYDHMTYNVNFSEFKKLGSDDVARWTCSEEQPFPGITQAQRRSIKLLLEKARQAAVKAERDKCIRENCRYCNDGNNGEVHTHTARFSDGRHIHLPTVLGDREYPCLMSKTKERLWREGQG